MCKNSIEEPNGNITKPIVEVLFGGLDKYFDDLERYEDELYCSHCGNSSKKTFNYRRTVANGQVFFCYMCKEENVVSNKPNEDDY